MAPPTRSSSRPGRYLAVLAVLLIVLLGVAAGKYVTSPGSWHKGFKVGLGLDLSSGTTVTLQAVSPKKGTVPSQADMNEAISIINDRVNAIGVSGASVVQQGNDIINVSVPGKGSKQVDKLVGTTALLRLRQVLLCSGESTQCLPEQDLTPSTGTSPSPSPSASSSGKASASPSAPAKASPTAKTSSSPNGSGQAVGARQLAGSGAAAKSRAAAAAKASASPSPAPSASSSAATPAYTGDVSLVQPSVLKLFNKLNCADKNWQSQIYGDNSNAWDDPNSQIVSCGEDPAGVKYVLDVAKVTGAELRSPTAELNTNGEWVVNFNLDGKGTTAFADLTSSMYDHYYDSTSNSQTSVLDQFAIVLDGVVIQAPDVIQPITAGSGQISGNFTQTSATNLANVLKYGALPLSFNIEQSSSVSPTLGAAQLHAGLIAGAIGLLLVVIYSFIYYRGLGVVSVSSLAIAAALAYLAVVLLTRYENFSLTLAGVAGLIVAIGITADSFVVFFERLRDEVREGRSLKAAVERGWTRARRTIIVSDTVSFLAAALLYFFAIGDVKGFAFTLGLTTLIDIVVVFLFTKPMITLLARTKFYGQGHRLSGLDATRLGARTPWRGARRTPGTTPPSAPKEA